VVDAYFPVIEQFGERIQHLESAAIDDPSPLVLVQMQRLRHQLLTLRRAVWPMREEIGILQREESDLVTRRRASSCATSTTTPCRRWRSWSPCGRRRSR